MVSQGEWESFFFPVSIAVGLFWVVSLPIVTAIVAIKAAIRVYEALDAKKEAAVTMDIARSGCTCCQCTSRCRSFLRKTASQCKRVHAAVRKC